MSLLRCEEVVLGYDGRPVLKQVNFAVEPGDYLCVVGENGSGKSTLIKGLLQLKAPLSGRIVTGDGLCPQEIGYLPQCTDIQRDFPASVREVVLSGTLNRLGCRPWYTRTQKQAALRAMDMLSIADLQNRRFQALSGGQQQRVLLARALCATQKLLLLDEPAAGLDPLATADLYRVIEHLNRDHGITVIMVTHDLSVVREAATHVLHLEHTQRFFGTREAYWQSEAGQAFAGGVSHA